MGIRAVLFIALAVVLTQTSFGATVAASAGNSSCTNLSGAPFNPSGDGTTLLAYFDCNLYPDASTYSFNPDLTSLMEYGNAALGDNLVGAGYFVVINGNPATLQDNNIGLFNQSLWQTVLFFSGDYGGGLTSDNLTVYWPAAFPTGFPTTVQNYNDNIIGLYLSAYDLTVPDSSFFIQYTPPLTVYQPGAPCTDFSPCSDEYNIGVPEPGTLLLLGSSLALLGGAVLRKRRSAGRAA
jgi:hypothetical protein